MMECAEKASGRTKWNREDLPGRAEHFTFRIQVKQQGCQDLLLLRPCSAKEINLAGRLPAPARIAHLELMNSEVPTALAERPANHFLPQMGFPPGNCVPGVSQ